MKKLSALILALALLVSVIPVAYAANATPNTTTLTTTVPSASYVLNIPADQEISFGETNVEIGNVTITDSKNFAQGKNVDVMVEYAPFAAEAEEINTTIPYELYKNGSGSADFKVSSGDKLAFMGRSDGTVEELAVLVGTSSTMRNLIVKIASRDWGKALAGNYKSTITFTSEIVVA